MGDWQMGLLHSGPDVATLMRTTVQSAGLSEVPDQTLVEKL